MSSVAKSVIEQAKVHISNDDVIGLSKIVASLKGDSRDENGRTLLHNAVASNATDAALYLLDNKVGGENTADKQDETPLMRAAWLGNEVLVAELIRAGADVNAKSRFTGGTALHNAYAGSTKPDAVVAVLVKAGADKTAVDNDGKAPEEWSTQAHAHETGAKAKEDRKTRLLRNRP